MTTTTHVPHARTPAVTQRQMSSLFASSSSSSYSSSSRPAVRFGQHKPTGKRRCESAAAIKIRSENEDMKHPHPLSPCVSELSDTRRYQQQYQFHENADGATMRYMDRSFQLLGKFVPPAGLLCLVSMFCATVFSVFFFRFVRV